ncbi:hypothetical protein A1O1_07770 [Capronia coronata CBS 617.96]|uniref:Pentacotripeptide-repeat region of PRORP domain-containing protein n=1 Tax=Capronia coronata CBS 617.96 TaxID=1182541 RepID=W9XWG4_9EURO|nr:uncharacterized protein A1O1_07770 [Capronia coronata CBS 617.96]EXJ81705.1 hypothetical protein A1O1_07770 [Capronia coronata CBS 617.96]
MHRLIAHHGLIQNRCPFVLRTRLQCAPLRVQAQQLNEGRGSASPVKNDGSTESAAASTLQEQLTLPEELKDTASHGHVVTPREDIDTQKYSNRSTQDFGAYVAGGITQDVGVAPTAPVRESAVQPPKKEETTQEEGDKPERKYLRRIPLPKRFPPLLREIQSVGHDHEISKTDRPRKSLDRSVVSTEILEAELRWVSRNHPHPKAVRNILEILIRDRKVKPSAAHYEALILANCFPELGTVENVKMILEEMEREGILIEPSIYYAVLTVLTVHPDTYLRTTIIQKLRQQWVSIPEFYAQLNAVAMIREGQLELATVELDNFQQKRIPIASWIWVIYVHAVCDRRDFEALLQILYKLPDEGFLFPRPTLLHLLVTASEHDSLDVTKYLWHSYVESMHIVPNEDLCMTVLRLAAKHQDLKLAESIAVVLESVAGDRLTMPPSLVDRPPPTKHETMSLTFDSPDLPDFECDSLSQYRTGSNDAGFETVTGATGLWGRMASSATSGPDSMSESERELQSEPLAMAFSTPLPLPHPAIRLRSRNLPEEAVQIIRDLGINTDRRGRNRRHRGILYPLFRKESGLRGARSDPRQALMQGWDWRKK